MPLQLHEQTATLTGTVTVDDAEAFTTWLRTTAEPRVDLHDCSHLHTAVFQAILVFAPTVIAGPTEPFLAGHVLPMLRSEQANAPETPEATNDDGDAGR
jgi:hypothetical protein